MTLVVVKSIKNVKIQILERLTMYLQGASCMSMALPSCDACNGKKNALWEIEPHRCKSIIVPTAPPIILMNIIVEGNITSITVNNVPSPTVAHYHSSHTVAGADMSVENPSVTFDQLYKHF